MCPSTLQSLKPKHISDVAQFHSRRLLPKLIHCQLCQPVVVCNSDTPGMSVLVTIARVYLILLKASALALDSVLKLWHSIQQKGHAACCEYICTVTERGLPLHIPLWCTTPRDCFGSRAHPSVGFSTAFGLTG